MVKLVKQTALILLICLIGELISRLINGYVPGNVIGMALLFTLLCLRIIKLEQVGSAADFFFSNITLFLIPAMVGLISSFDVVRDSFFLFIAVCVVSAAVVLLVTGQTVRLFQYLLRRRTQNSKERGV